MKSFCEKQSEVRIICRSAEEDCVQQQPWDSLNPQSVLGRRRERSVMVS